MRSGTQGVVIGEVKESGSQGDGECVNSLMTGEVWGSFYDHNPFKLIGKVE